MAASCWCSKIFFRTALRRKQALQDGPIDSFHVMPCHVVLCRAALSSLTQIFPRNTTYYLPQARICCDLLCSRCLSCDAVVLTLTLPLSRVTDWFRFVSVSFRFVSFPFRFASFPFRFVSFFRQVLREGKNRQIRRLCGRSE